jgi:hypothetical protein
LRSPQAHLFQGYIVPPLKKGADGSIDILAGSGSLGLLSPKLVVEVKSGTQVADHKTLEALRGAVQSVGADYGLLVSWGGFTKAVLDRERELHFKVRLWNRVKIMDALLDAPEKEDIRKKARAKTRRPGPARARDRQELLNFPGQQLMACQQMAGAALDQGTGQPDRDLL